MTAVALTIASILAGCTIGAVTTQLAFNIHRVTSKRRGVQPT